MNNIASRASAPNIVVTSRDFERLQVLIASTESDTEKLDSELSRAEVVTQAEIGANVVTMNSDVVYEDLATGTRRNVRVVFPQDADLERGWVSVLAPLGSALIGLRVDQQIDWHMPSGVRRLRVVDVPYQPEASGDFEL